MNLRDSTVAVGLDRLERKFDRQLGKIFKKKSFASASIFLDSKSQSTISLSGSGPLNLDTQTFPSPSFIKPTSTRMLARDEIILTSRPARRTQSLPETPSTPGVPSVTVSVDPVTPPNREDQNVFLRIPQRSSSLNPRRHRGTSLAELLEFDFSNTSTGRSISPMPSPRSRSRSGSKSPSRPVSVAISTPPSAPLGRESQLCPLQTEPADHRPYGLLTPPPSAQHDKFTQPAQSPRGKQLPPLVPLSIPTPEASPRLVPLPGSASDEPEVDRIPNAHPGWGSDLSVSDPKEKSVLAKEGQALVIAKSKSKGKTVLQEPTFGDFLSLSDDDVADAQSQTQAQATSQDATPSRPPRCGLPPNPPRTLISPKNPKRWPLLTLSPPLASRPATAGAFEAARIAAKYRFDLVYVVNLYPLNMTCSQPKPASRKGSFSSLATSATITPATPGISSSTDIQMVGQGEATSHNVRFRMTGKLLAAYGLPSLMSPFRISAPVHKKILRTEGWLEYRSDSGDIDEFSRGYSCSFYTGHSPDGRWRPVDPSSQSAQGSEGEQGGNRKTKPAINRGIVFAAYRLPRQDGSNIFSDAQELDALHKDAETLVDLLVDIGNTQSQWRRDAMLRKCTEAGAGPLPGTSTSLVSV